MFLTVFFNNVMCTSPIWIRNRRYFDKKRPRRGRSADDDHLSAISLRPWDIARQWLLVPCGRCEECLKKLRNDWYVRIERELTRCRDEHKQACFLTISIAPKYYDDALDNPSWFIRKFNERIRHKFGTSIKHFFLQEFGTHPQTGDEPRLHFHGFLFGLEVSYNSLRSAIGDLGFIWISNASRKRARYCVKYVCKDIAVTRPDGTLVLNQSKKYTRKYVSAHLGDYLGRFARPSSNVTSWSYMDFKTGQRFSYSIPRYYDRYLKQEDEFVRAIRSSDTYARFSDSRLVRDVVDFCVKRFVPNPSLSRRESLMWRRRKFQYFNSAQNPKPDIEPPVWLDSRVFDYWASSFNLTFI